MRTTEVRGTGLFTAIDLTIDKKTKEPLPLENITSMINRAKSKGLIIKLAPVRLALEFAPPLNIEKEIIDEALNILEEVITEEEQSISF